MAERQGLRPLRGTSIPIIQILLLGGTCGPSKQKNRRGRDSNPGSPKGQRFSRPPLSTTQPPLHRRLHTPPRNSTRWNGPTSPDLALYELLALRQVLRGTAFALPYWPRFGMGCSLLKGFWRGGRVAEGGSLLNCCGCKPTGGSNPLLSAIFCARSSAG